MPTGTATPAAARPHRFVMFKVELPKIPSDGTTGMLVRCDDNDNDNDTLRKVPHPSNEGLEVQARVKGS